MRPFKFGRVVDGEYFCARPRLERELVGMIKNAQNAVVMGERRMGKTSLMKAAAAKARGWRILYVDLMNMRTIADFCNRVAYGASRLGNGDSFLRKTLKFLSRLRPTLGMDAQTGLPTVTVDATLANDTMSLTDVLNMVENYSKEMRLCVVLDEFQDILNLDDADQVLAILRGRIQFLTNSCFLFSGSVRGKMQGIFNDPDSAFYKSALTVEVGPIDDADFKDFIAAKFKAGKRKIAAGFLDAVLACANRTTGDVQELCDSIWCTGEEGETLDDAAIWRGMEDVFAKESRGYEDQCEKLTRFQFKAMVALAKWGGRQFFSSESLRRAEMPSGATAKRAIDRLVSDKVVYLHKGEYKFFNPFFKAWILSKTF